MPRLTYAQMEGYWIKAGGPKELAPVAAAIGEAESGGNTDAINPNDNGGRQSSYGVWQISNGTHTPPSANWADPATNASLAVGKFRGAGNSFSPWGTYDSGAYRAYMNGSTTPDMNVQGNPNAVAAQTAAHVDSDCLYKFGGAPGTSIIGDLTGSGGNLGEFCVISRSQARGVAGVFMMIVGTLGAALSLGLIIGVSARANPVTGALNRRAADEFTTTEADMRAADAAAAQRARDADRRARQPQGRHAKSGPTAPAGGKHARP